MDKDQYAKLLNESITKAYSKTNKNCVNKINKDARNIVRSLSVDDRIEKNTRIANLYYGKRP